MHSTWLLLLVTMLIIQGIFGLPRHYVDNNINGCDCVCGASNRRMRVVGGNLTKVDEFPWIAALAKGGDFYCGASLITRRHVVTAAHCVNGFDPRTISVVLADHDRDSTTRFERIVTRMVRNIYKHAAFDSTTYNNDIAVIELDEPVTFNEHVQAICLPQTETFNYAGRFGVVAGWGRLGEREKTSHVLRKVVVPVWTRDDCYNSGYGEERLSENMFCAGYPDGERDACQGDSGGPLHINTATGDAELIGVVSWGRGCGRPNLPGIYTKITNYLDWIGEQLQGECLCSPASPPPRRA